MVWLLAVLLKKNRAEPRYLLWLIASVKFLFPWSLLIGLGSHLALPGTPPVAEPGLFIAIEAIGQPFSPAKPVPIPPGMIEVAFRNLPTVLLMVWFAGCGTVLLVWYLRWRRLIAARRADLPSKSGRELEALRRMERSVRSSRQIGLLLSQSAMEPGILGVFRPVLVLPVGISERLTDAQLESVIAHELCHVRRRDNLAAALHMLVEALFWFHPLVWWIGMRLVDERERACDEEVLSLGTDPQVYAEGILKVCNFYLESPLFCAAGVTGSHLKTRIEAIMIRRIASKLEMPKKVLLGAVGMAAILGPVVFGALNPVSIRAHSRHSQAQSRRAIVPSFEAVTIKPHKNGEPIAGFPTRAIWYKPDGFVATDLPLHALIAMAYEVEGSEIVGGPDWVRSEDYDVEAKLDTPVIDELSKLGPDELVLEQKRILRALLADRFRLALHRETREPPAYVLAIARDGLKLQEAKPGDAYPDGFKDPQGRPLGRGALLQPGPCKLVGQGVHMADVAKTLSINYLGGRTVVDQTGLRGVYDFTLDCHTAFIHRGESVLTVLPEQLGLEVKPLDVLVIDHAEQIRDEPRETELQDQSVAESLAANLPPALVYQAVSITPSSSQASPVPERNFTLDGFTATNVTLQNLIEWAYNVEGLQISGAPDWVNAERYDVQASVDRSWADELGSLSEEQRGARQQPMLLELLADQFKLEAHRGTSELPVYELFVAGSGPKLQHAKSGEPPFIREEMGLIAGQAVPGRSLVRLLSELLGRPVLDKTGLKGTYDFSVEWPPSSSQSAIRGPSIFAAVQEQLGLELLPSHEQTAPVQTLIIDHVEKPSAN